jgi:hypothetical protein
VDKSRLDDETVLVGFELPAGLAATSVSLVGDFNGWSPDSNRLTLLDDGRFRTELPLPAGHRWRFRYVLDGDRWENDWAADDYVPNGLGADDSVVDLTDARGIPLTATTTTLADETEAKVTAAGETAADGEPTRRRWWQFWGRRGLATA